MISRHFEWCCNYMYIEHNGQACLYVVPPKTCKPWANPRLSLTRFRTKTFYIYTPSYRTKWFQKIHSRKRFQKYAVAVYPVQFTDFVWINRRSIRRKKRGGFKSIRIRVSSVTCNTNFLFSFLFSTLRFTFKGVRKNGSWLYDTHSQSFMGHFVTLLTPHPVPGKKKRGYGFIPNC